MLQVGKLKVAVTPTRTAWLSVEVARGQVVVAAPPDRADGRIMALVLAGLHPWLAGDVMVDGTSIARSPDTSPIRHVIAQGALMPDKTVEQNIEHGPRIEGTKDPLVRELRDHLMTRLDLWSRRDQRPHELTADQRFRVALARALLTRPEALVVDLTDFEGITTTLRDIPGLALLGGPAEGQGVAVLVVSAHPKVLAQVDRHVPIWVRDAACPPKLNPPSPGPSGTGP